MNSVTETNEFDKYIQYLKNDGTKFSCFDKGLIELDLVKIFKDPRFSRVQIVFCGYNQLTELTIPEGVQEVYCGYNQLTELILPKGIKEIFCSHNQLTELTLPEGVKKVYCSHNQLTELILPEGVKKVNCYHNQLTRLTLPEGVEDVMCNDNLLTELTILSEELYHLNCRNNELYEMPIVPNGCELWYNIKPKPIPVTLITSSASASDNDTNVSNITDSDYRCIYCHSDSLKECSEMWGKKVRGIYLHSCCRKTICEPALLQWLNECEKSDRSRECMYCKQTITAYSIFN